MDEKNIHMDDFENGAPILNGLEKRYEEKIPENYFSELPGRIQDRISNSETKAEKVSVFSPKLGIASALFASLLLLIWFLPGHQNKDNYQWSLSEEVIYEYLIDESESVSEELIMEDLMACCELNFYDESQLNLNEQLEYELMDDPDMDMLLENEY